MKSSLQKRYILVIAVIAVVGVLLWRLSGSYASVDQGYSGKNIISGDKWGINIINVGEVEKSGNAVVSKEISTIGTTLNFSAILYKPGDKISFDIEVYALTLTGLNDIDSEDITYTILPIDGSILHDDETEGSIIKSGEKQKFNITLVYDETATNDVERHLSLGSTIIYRQK